MIAIREGTREDADEVWKILEPIIRAGETLCLPRDMDRESLLAYWFQSHHEVFVAEFDGVAVGTYYLRPNQFGGGSHVANCGYVTSSRAGGKGIGRAMCAHSMAHARDRGYRSMQFNIVVSSNEKAVFLWKRMGFKIVGVVPKAFRHPILGLVDALVMFQDL